MRLIFVPQLPIHMRYQEWWFTSIPEGLSPYFDDVVVLGKNLPFFNRPIKPQKGEFSTINMAVEFETFQIQEYMRMELASDDVLLLADISFPGLFAPVLFAKRPQKCYAICHASSLNRYDYWTKVRKMKWPVEKGTMGLFDKIIVASEYHQKKLQSHGISNTYNMGALPNPPEYIYRIPLITGKENLIASVAREGIQKHNILLESQLGRKIEKRKFENWEEYYTFLAQSKILLITAKEETYGYQCVDALLMGCVPLTPRKYSYPELLSDECLYSSLSELKSKIIKHSEWELYRDTAKLKNQNEIDQFYGRLAGLLHGRRAREETQ